MEHKIKHKVKGFWGKNQDDLVNKMQSFLDKYGDDISNVSITSYENSKNFNKALMYFQFDEVSQTSHENHKKNMKMILEANAGK